MQMGIGRLGQPNVIIKRKNRWTMAISTPCGQIPIHYCRTSAKPSLDIESVEVNFLNATTWVPGKAKWQPITVTYLDVASQDMQGLYDWINTVYQFDDPVNLGMSEKSGWAGNALLQTYDGCGGLLETWLLGSVWPESINFGELNYESGEFSTIDLTLRYSEVKYISNCGVGKLNNCCRGCDQNQNQSSIF